MSFIELKFPSGMYRIGTKYQAKGRWFNGNLVRWLRDSLRPVGGWAHQSETGGSVLDLTGTPRGAKGWEVAGGRSWQAYGTISTTAADVRLYAFSLGILYDISYQTTSTLYQETFTQSNGVDITDPALDYSGGSGFLDVQGNKIQQKWAGSGTIKKHYQVDLSDNDDIVVYADMERPSAGSATEAGITFWHKSDDVEFCVFRWVNVDASTVKLNCTRFDSGGGQDTQDLDATYSWAEDTAKRMVITVVAGVVTAYIEDEGGGNSETIGIWTNLSEDWRDADHLRVGIYYITAGTAPLTWDNITVTQDGAGWVAGDVDTTLGGGAGSGFYGALNYGEGVYGVGQSTLGTVAEADIWHLDTFGNFLIACDVPANNEIYWWNPATPSTRIKLLSDEVGADSVPTNNRGIVVTPERFLVALGSDGNARQVHWADRESLLDWNTSDPTNEAGALVLEGSGRLMRGLRGKQQTLLWTDAELWGMVYIGGTFIYSFMKRGSQCGLIAPLAVAETSVGHVWMGSRQFFIYDGFVRPLPCDVADYVFNDMNKDQRIKINCFVNHEFTEVWWYYPSETSTEIDRYVIWNYVENHWSLGFMDRTCGIEATTTTTKPVLLDSSGRVYQHEIGYDHTINQSSNFTPFAESGPIEIGKGDRVMHVLQILPDEENLGDVQTTIFSMYHPTEDEVTHGPFSSAEPTPVRLSGRAVRLRVDELQASLWRVGNFRFDVRMGGKR